MPHPFDQLEQETLREKSCMKWQRYENDVLPLWVADMDFPIAEPIRESLLTYARGDNFGYPKPEGLPGLKEVVQARLSERYGWSVEPGDIHLINGIVPGLYLGALALAGPGEEVMIHTPMYPPFMKAIKDTGRTPLYSQLVFTGNEWQIDFDKMEAQLTPATRLMMLCNPHNPSGRVFRREELERLADFALRHRLWVVSDELHSDLTYEGHEHIPFASLSEEVAERTVTLYGPTKTFNIAGLKIGFLIAQNRPLLKRMKEVAGYLVAPPNVMAQTATMAAYERSQDWYKSMMGYLDDNRRFVHGFLDEHLPQVKHMTPEGTYLSFMDFSALDVGKDLYDFLLEDCRVGLNDGPAYGPGGEGFTRLNFATSRAIVEEALERIKRGVEQRV